MVYPVMSCPVCDEEVDYFDICENCGWHNSGPKESEDGHCGPHSITLREAKELHKNGKEFK